MNITEIKETIDILSFLSSKWKKRTIIAAIELLFFFQYVYCVFLKCINLSNCGIEIIYNISYLKNISILYIVLSFVIFFIWFFSVRIKKINKNNIGIVFAIETENLKQKKRLSYSFYDKVVQIVRNSTKREIEIRLLDEYHSKRLRKDTKYPNILINKIKANIILYGKLEERRNNAKDLYSIDFNAIVRHKALPKELSQIISQEMSYILPKNINFELDNEFSSFTITSEIIGESVKFILGLSFAYSRLYDEAYKMHKYCLDISFSKIKSGKNNLLSQRMYQLSLSYAISELKQLAQISRIEGRLSESIEYINRALILNPEDYGALLEKSICCFLVGNIQESMNVLIKCSKNKSDYTWAYNKAFLHTFEGDFDAAYKLYKMVVNKPVGKNVANQCEIFIINYLKQYPEKYELFYALGMIYYKIKQDYQLACEYFNLFITNSEKDNNKYSDTIKYVILMKGNCERKLENEPS